ncbi:hypothetical protein PQ610_01735 [Tardisphaera miroshnichenkoae]
MKINAFFGMVSGVLLAVSAAVTPSPIPLIMTFPFMVDKKRVFIAELLVVASSFFLLRLMDRFSLFAFTERTLTYVNLYLMASSLIDRASILGFLGKRGVPLVLALGYFPYFLSVASDVAFYARARGLTSGLGPRRLFSLLSSLALPFIVEVVRVAENLYIAYSIKLYGRGAAHAVPRPSAADLSFLAYGVLALCLSFTLRF